MMKTIGLIGGISWHATAKYYQFINQAINEHFGDNTNPPLLTFNINQSKMHKLQKLGDWEGIADMIFAGAEALIRGGAKTLFICSNTSHKVHPLVAERVKRPFLHIGDATANHVQRIGLNKVGFIGTRFGMEDPFLLDRIRSFGIDVISPEDKSTIIGLHEIIHNELTYNKVIANSIQYVKTEINRMKAQGIQGIILGCTEFSLMFEQIELDIPVLDTVSIHADAAVEEILSVIND